MRCLILVVIVCGTSLELRGQSNVNQPQKDDGDALASIITDAREHQDPRPKSPMASLRSIHVPDGFRVELVAAEPMVQDPVSFDWGPDGKLWVVEMGDYPLGLNNDGSPGGRVRCLEDTDDDGQYDKSTLFLDGLKYPTGVMAWRNGVIVSAAPDILFASDTDGDGKADQREILFRGFVEGNQQHRVNGFAWGLDNWVHVANGDSGGTIESIKTGEKLNIGGRDLRIRPDKGRMQPQTGQTQFGRRRDDWGNWFSCSNPVPLRHMILADHYLRRNPHFAPRTVRRDIAVTGNTRVFPLARVLSHWSGYRPPRPGEPHRFTSACGISVYRDDLFGANFADNTFTCEPVHNLVHRRILSPQGTSFSSRRPDGEITTEFLASTDSWFRPTTVRTGPDGGIWISDMYRLVIEHTQYIDDAEERRLDLRAGDDRGRIYRVVPIAKPARRIPRLAHLTTAELVRALDSPNGWQRDTVQRMLIHRNDQRAVQPLASLLDSSAHPLTRLHAMCSLDGMSALRAEQVVKSLTDPHPGVRRHAVRLSETHLSNDAVIEKLTTMTDDDDKQVLLQLAYTLGEADAPQAGQALARILLANHRDEFQMAAGMSSLNKRNLTTVLNAVLSQSSEDDSLEPVEARILQIAAAFGESQALTKAVQTALGAEAASVAWQGKLTRLLQIVNRSQVDLLRSLDEASIARLRRLRDNLEKRIGAAETAPDIRLSAISLLGAMPAENPDNRPALLSRLLDARNDPALQKAGIASLARLTDRSVASSTLDRWSRLSPNLRTDVLDLLLTRQTWTEVILERLAGGQLAAGDLSPSHQQRLLLHETATIQDRAKKLLEGSTKANRQELIVEYKTILQRKGDRVRGRTLFAKHCSACHRVEQVGYAVGPDLLTVQERSPLAMLTAILAPNRSIEDKYRTYTVQTNGGQSLAGIVASETSTSLTLSMKEGKQRVILRRDIENLVGSKVSLMPEGIEKELPPAEMTDLLTYITELGPPPKSFPGNQPREIVAGNDGVLRLPAAASRIYGSTVVFESKYGNLGYWRNEDDRAEWSIVISKSGEYEVAMDYACDNGTANNRFLLRIGTHALTGKVTGTGTWDDYAKVNIGRMRLDEGRQQVTFRSQGKPSNCLIDLRALVIRLVDEEKE